MSWKSRDHKVKHWAGSDFQKVSLAVERAYKPEAKRHFPGTMQLVEDLGLISMREVAFNKQSPQSGLIRHSDKFNYMLTGHLGVSVPKAEEGGGGGLDTPSEKKQPGRQLEEGAEAEEGAAQEEEEEKEKEDDDDDDDDDDSGGGDGKEGALCGLEIDGSVQVWEEGKLLVIDNSFMHRTWNDSPDESRVILYFDFWHPDLTEEEKRALVIFRRLFKERSVEKEKERRESAKALDRLFRV